MRPNQEKTVEAFRLAIANGRKNLLMYAVMRFGKSFTSMCCAVEMGAKLVVVVSAKADVKTEWKKTVESHVKFDSYEFVTADTLSHNNHAITERLNSGKRVVVFLTLQDLQGDQIKDKHQEVFGQDIDLLLVDETHFGARAEKYGEVLKNAKNYESDVKNKKDSDDFVDVDEADKTIKTLQANITIHLSGTPYRILMGSEFKKEDIIAFYQFTDIVDDQKAWDIRNFNLPEAERKEEWENPYYGFPQMVRFAFRPNESSRRRLEELRKAGTTYAFSALFKPQSIKKTDDGAHKKFKYEEEILDLLEVIDGSKSDDELLGFLDYDKLKQGEMCRHIVIVLPYCASCDALEELIKTNKQKFRNLDGYEIVNISGVDKPNAYRTPKDIKNAITQFEKDGKRTITLTVNRMLTGSTVPEWDTMIYLKDTASPQEYDQAVFRLQNQYVKTYKDATADKIIKLNMKPQTLLVDFDPNRMFVMQEKKSKIYNANVDTGGNSELEKRIRKELEISPIITINKDKIERVVATDILEAVSNYQKDKGIKDEALDIPVDLSILDDDAIRAVIELENEIGSKSGLYVPAHDGEDEGDGGEIDVPEGEGGQDGGGSSAPGTPTSNMPPASVDDKHKQEISLTKKVQSYYTRILLFAFITKDTVISLSNIIAKMETEENGRIAKNLGLSKNILSLINQKTNKFVLSDLDYKIQDLNSLSRATDLSPAERANVAVNKFGKLGDAIVITPSNICDDMVNLLPEEFIKSLPTTDGKMLDVAGTAGEFAVALHKRMTELGLEKGFISNAIYTIPKSPICYELTRKLYEMLELNSANIAKEFVATDMLDVKIGKEIDYDKIKALLTQNKPFETIKLTDTITEGETKMLKFEAVVGNPPYQEDDGGNGISSRPIYNHFVIASKKINPEYMSIITPSRWFNGGKGLDAFRNNMLNDSSIEKIVDYQNAKECFPDLSIGGGVSYFLRNKNYNGKCEIINILGGNKKSMLRLLNEYEPFIRYNDAVSIIKKVKDQNEEIITSVISSRNPFGLSTKERGFIEERPNCVKLYTSAGLRYIEKEKVVQGQENIDKYKVMISRMACEHAGEPDKNGQYRIISTIKLLEANTVCTDSYIIANPSGCKEEVINFISYIKTRFVRFLILQTLSSINMSKERYAFVPLQDFSKSWTDTDLYAKYNLTEEEISFIESMIKPME